MIRFIAQSWTVPAGLRPLEALGAGGSVVWIDSMQVRAGPEQPKKPGENEAPSPADRRYGARPGSFDWRRIVADVGPQGI